MARGWPPLQVRPYLARTVGHRSMGAPFVSMVSILEINFLKKKYTALKLFLNWAFRHNLVYCLWWNQDIDQWDPLPPCLAAAWVVKYLCHNFTWGYGCLLYKFLFLFILCFHSLVFPDVLFYFILFYFTSASFLNWVTKVLLSKDW